MTRKLWTADEDATLRRSWGKMPARAIAVTLGRPRHGVLGRARRLGLSRLRDHQFDQANGTVTDRGDRRAINIYFDAETFAEVAKVAKQDGLPFSRAALQLIEWGLMERENS